MPYIFETPQNYSALIICEMEVDEMKISDKQKIKYKKRLKKSYEKYKAKKEKKNGNT